MQGTECFAGKLVECQRNSNNGRSFKNFKLKCPKKHLERMCFARQDICISSSNAPKSKILIFDFFSRFKIYYMISPRNAQPFYGWKSWNATFFLFSESHSTNWRFQDFRTLKSGVFPGKRRRNAYALTCKIHPSNDSWGILGNLPYCTRKKI